MIKILIIGLVAVKKNSSRTVRSDDKKTNLFPEGDAWDSLCIRRGKFSSGYEKNPTVQQHHDALRRDFSFNFIAARVFRCAGVPPAIC